MVTDMAPACAPTSAKPGDASGSAPGGGLRAQRYKGSGFLAGERG
jgi:hypothetical protein